MLKGIHLSLLIGPKVPIPAPASVINSINSIQVSNSNERSGFQISFSVSKNSPLLTTMLPVGYFDPMVTRVIIIVTLGGLPTVLIDGIITRQELAPSNEPGKSTLTITGEDLSVLMNVIERFRDYPAMPEVATVMTVLAFYADLGIQPVVIPPGIVTVYTPLDSSKKGKTEQYGMTDYDYIRALASNCGYVFYIEPLAPGTNIAYFGPDIRIPNPQPALTVNMDAHSNVESLSFSLDGLAKKVLVAIVLDSETGKIQTPIPVPNLNIFRPPLGLRLTPPSKVEYPRQLSNLAHAEAAKRILGVLSRSSDAIAGNGSLDVLRYGRILRSRQLVGIRGAGLAYDGMYYVNSVTHNIKRGEYKQNFTLSRDGLISSTPKVLV
jgi:hypothetical protein